MFIHCITKYIASTFHWNKKRWELLQNCILNFCGSFKNGKPKFWKFIVKLKLLNWLPNEK